LPDNETIDHILNAEDIIRIIFLYNMGLLQSKPRLGQKVFHVIKSFQEDRNQRNFIKEEKITLSCELA
jgi:hypothetical protein